MRFVYKQPALAHPTLDAKVSCSDEQAAELVALLASSGTPKNQAAVLLPHKQTPGLPKAGQLQLSGRQPRKQLGT